MRIVVIGCVDFSRALLERTMDLGEADVVGVVTRASSAFNSDFCSLEGHARRAGVPCLIDAGNNQGIMAEWIAALRPDVVYCFGWPYLLNRAILGIAPLGVIGYHPTLLPKNRGRHPIIWTLALGLSETGSSFFFMDEGADSGDLLAQERVPVSDEDDAASLYERLKETALRQVAVFTPQLAAGTFLRTRQDQTQANYWRKRSKADGRIDWRMPAKGIADLVRSLTHPYVGAHVESTEGDVKVWRCEIPGVASREMIANVEPGRVVAASALGLDVRCGDGVVRLTEHEFIRVPRPGDCL